MEDGRNVQRRRAKKGGGKLSTNKTAQNEKTINLSSA
jgi:hypothetical protein